MKRLIITGYIIVYGVTLYARDDYFFNFNNQRSKEYIMRSDAASQMTLMQPEYDITVENNGDATAENLFAAAHTKSLTHDSVTGLLTPEGVQSYQQLLTAIDSTQQGDYNAIVRFPGSSKLVNPQASNMLTLEGIPNNLMPIPVFPHISSTESAALIIELYLQGLCRGVFFSDYGTGQGTDVDSINGGSITNNASAILTALGSAYTGPTTESGEVTPDLLFRIDGNQTLIGPYVSQFLFFNIPIEFQLNRTFQPFVNSAQNREFGVSFSDFIAVQNGTTPRPYIPSDFSGTRYISMGRDMATLVHSDGPGEIFFYVANILLNTYPNGKFPFSSALPYYNSSITNEAAFVGMAAADVYCALFGATSGCLKHAWAHKWRGGRVLRPDAFGGLVHNVQISRLNPLNLDQSIFADYQTPAGNVNLLDWVKAHNTIQQTDAVQDPLTPPQAETYLLAQMYPEGSPVHPSYPAGHATYAGACVTILKAFFQNDFLIKNLVTPVQPNPANPTQLIPLPSDEADLLTVGGELNKLAYNIPMGRNFAGIHYRIDGLQGILLGEQVALNYLRDHARYYNEQTFTGFSLTKFDGTHVVVTADGITTI
jgi:hypothetical protein